VEHPGQIWIGRILKGGSNFVRRQRAPAFQPLTTRSRVVLSRVRETLLAASTSLASVAVV